jgi:hypothetical protein
MQHLPETLPFTGWLSFASGNPASGEYRAFSTGVETREGLAEGVRIEDG